jgi:hypothetical protein
MKYIYSNDISFALRSRRSLEEKNKVCVVHKCKQREYIEKETWVRHCLNEKILVSSWGHIDRQKNSGEIMPVCGYNRDDPILSVFINGRKYQAKHLVAECFNAYGNGEYVININRDPYDNMIDNLRFVPKTQVRRHRISRELTATLPLTQFTLGGSIVQKWNNADEAASVLGFRKGDILMCAEGEVLTAHDFIWIFGDDIHISRLQSLQEKIRLLEPFIIIGTNRYCEYVFSTISEAGRFTGLTEYEVMKRCIIMDDYPDWTFTYTGKTYKRSEIIWKD